MILGLIMVIGLVVLASAQVDIPEDHIGTAVDTLFTGVLDAAYAVHGVLSLTPTDSITGSDLVLGNAQGITTFKSGSNTYAAVAAYDDDGVQILNVTDPSNIIATDSITNGGSLELNGAQGITIFKSGGNTYAAVAADDDDSVQILNVTDPSNIIAADSITDTPSLVLNNAYGITTFKSGSNTYAAVAAHYDDGVQILNVTDPSNIIAADSITDTPSLVLNGASSITTFVSGSNTYAAVTAYDDDGVQILNVTDPSNIIATDSIIDTDTLELDGASSITIFKSGSNTYAAVAAYDDNGVQILNVTDPSNIIAADSITDDDNLELNNASGITTFESGGHIYAAVTAFFDDSVQILDVTDPLNIIATDSITDGGSLELDGAYGITTFKSGGHTYAAVAAYTDDGVQIIRIDITSSDTMPPILSLTGNTSVTISVGTTYNDEGAICEDNADGTIIPTVVSNTVDTTQTGTYAVTYSCTDAANNSATQVSRTVIVQTAVTPGTTPPTFVSSELDTATMVLTITFSEIIDATNVDAAKIHIRESGTYTGGITLTANELVTTTNASTISFTLTMPHLETVKGLTTPELTVEPGAVRDTSGNLIVGTFDVSTASYAGDVERFSVSGQDTSPQGMAFSNDGAKMFVVGWIGEDINEYTLSTPFDVSTASYDGNAERFSVSEQDTAPRGMAFSNDGAKMFVVGWIGEDINEYTLSTPFDVSTASYAGDVERFSVSGQDISPQGMAFSNDGAKMFVTGALGDDVNEYTLSTPFDVSTATFDDVVFSVAMQETTPTGMAFSNDGLKMFVVGWDADNINEYTLSTPFDVSTATFANVVFSVSMQETTPTGMAFSNDGAKMFVIGTVGDDINEYTLSSVYPITVTSPPAGAFITTWRTTSTDKSITLPISGSGMTVNWGDGNTTTGVSAPVDHIYNTAGNYTVSISGGLERFHLDSQQPNAGRLASIEQWGDTRWTTMHEAFYGARNMVYNATDSPDLSTVTDMSSMFADASSFNGNISGWDVSKVTDMNSMFNEATSFNQPLNSWNVSSVKNMGWMFNDASSFNQPLNSWDVSSVTDMYRMFNNASSFNQTLNSWDVSSVTDMARMFNNADSINQTLNSWDVSSVTDMFRMFNDADSFNQPLNSWNVSKVTSMFRMFTNADSFNQPLNSWNVSRVTNMDDMFNFATAFSQNLGEWYVTLDPDTIAGTGIPGVVGTISAQNQPLKNHSPTYVIVDGLDKNHFEIAPGNQLNMTSGVSGKAEYSVNVTASGGSVFESGNNWRVLAVRVSGDNNADLGGLTISSGTLSPQFSSSDITYTASVDNSVTQVTVTPTVSDSSATITVNDNDVPSGNGYIVTGLTVGEPTTVTVIVTAQDSTTKTYIITLTRAASLPDNADLTSLTISSGTLSPQFSSSVTVYTASVDNSVTQVTVTPTASDSLATITVNGNGVTSGNGYIVTGLTVGTNTVTVLGIAEDITIKIYTITITRAAAALSDNADLGGLTISSGTLSPSFSSSDITYTASVDNSVTQVTVTPIASHSLATITVNDNDVPSGNGYIVTGLTVGEPTTVTVIVTAQDSTTKTYTVTLTRAAALSDTPPTFVSSKLDSETGVLTIIFSEDIDATPNTRIVPDKIHIRESGSYTGGVTLTANELVTTTNASTISFTLTMPHLETVKGLTTPELTVEPGAVRDTSGNLIVGTFDVSTASYAGDVERFSVSGQDTSPQGMAFSNDGAKMFVVGWIGEDINEYTLSTPFDVSTASYDGNAERFSVSEQDTAPRGMAFSNDGAKMFVVGWIGEDINEYTLSTPFDVSTASYAGDVERFSVSGQDISPQGMAFSNDGAKMFVTGALGDDVNEYTLSTPFDVSTATFDDVVFSVAMQETTPTGMAFSNDGLKMFVVGWDADNINEYTLSTPFDVSTATFANVVFSVSMQETTPTGMAFSNDGAKMFVVGSHSSNVNEYALSSVYPLSVVSNMVPTDDHFVTTWRTGADNETVTIPVYSGPTYYYTVIWGDGTNSTGVTDNASHTYAAAGDHQVRIYGIFLGIHLDGHADASKLASIDQWGSNQWASMASAFKGASSMKYEATDAPDLSGVTDMTRMFSGAESFNGDLSNWNVSQVTDMSSMFAGADAFDGDISSWNVSQVTDMSSMFAGADAFNGDLSNWNVSQVTDMSSMFAGADAFDGDISSWSVSQVTDMSYMFSSADNFNQPLNGWDVSAVTTMSNMFASASAFNPPLNDWDVSSVTDMSGMFHFALNFNRPLNNWNVSDVTDMSGMFQFAFNFDQNLGEWYVTLDPDTIAGTGIPGVVGTISAQNQPLKNHSPTYVIVDGLDKNHFEIVHGNQLNMTSGVSGKAEYSVNVAASGSNVFESGNNWRLLEIKVTGQTTDTTPPVIKLEGSSLVTITVDDTYTEQGAVCDDDVDADKPATVGGDIVNTSTVGQYTVTYDCTDSSNNEATQVSRTVNVQSAPDTTLSADAFVTTWKTASADQSITINFVGDDMNISWGDDGMTETNLSGSQTHTYINAGNYTVSVTGGLTGFHLNDAADASKLVSLDQWGNTTWTTMENAFYGADNMAYNAADSPDLSTVTDMTSMFRGASSFNGNISGWDVSSVTNMFGMFVSADSFNQPLNSWDVSSVTDMFGMFYYASDFNQPLNSWNVSSVNNMDGMFLGASSFNQPLNNWDVSKVTDMRSMFYEATDFNQPLNDWDVSRVTNMDDMFYLATAFSQNLGEWYVTLDPDTIAGTGIPGVVGTISAQNQPLKNHSPTYVIVDGLDKNHFEIVPGNQLNMTSGVSGKAEYSVNVTASGGSVFESGNNWRLLEIKVTGQITDTTPPVIKLEGSSLVTITVDETYTEQGAVCDDDVDADKPATVGGDTVDTSTVRQYTVTYDCTDTAGNVATQVLRTVNVQSAPDTDAPVIIITGSANIQLTVDDTYTEQGAVCDDDVDADKPATVGGDTVDTSTVGQYTVTYDCTDTAGNVATQVLRTVNVQSAPDTDAPVIIITGSANIQLTVDDTYTEQGAVCDDDVDADKPATVGGDTVDTSTVRQYTVTYDCTDTAGNVATQVLRTVNVQDAPVTTLPADAFITTWRTDSANQTITIPVGGSTARYSIDWGDNSPAETDITGDSTHTYREADSYTVSISGGLERIYLDGQQPNAGRLASIEQWGDTRWTTMDAAFYGARNMVYNAADSPDLSTVTDMSGMFGDAIAFNGDLSSWDVSKVTDMSDMFIFAYDFNGNLSSWDVSSVTNMNEMFAVATSFNGDLSSWDVSKVTDMSDMFIFATSFNGNLSSWDVSAVTDMSSMFDGTTAFNGDLSSWDVSSVTDMNNMFYYDTSFNQPLNDWDVSSVTEMDGMFFYTPSFTQNLGNWYVTLDPDTIADTGIPGVVGTISAQNQPLKNHSPTYVIVDGLDKNHFEIVPGNQLNMISGVSGKAEYSVNVTASGSNVFEDGNNWRVLVVKVSGDINAPPVLNTIDDQTVNEFVELTFTATASDDDSLTFSFDGTFPSGAAITDDGNFTWTPTESQDGDHTITVQVTDGSLTDSETLTVTVNEVNVAPVLNAIGDKGTSELVELTFTATASDTDVVDNVVNTLTFSFDGTFPSGAAITDDGNFTWTPTESQDGDHTITVQVTDGSLTDSETLTVTVRDVNVAPVLNTIDDQTVNEFVELTFTATASDDDSLTFSFDGTFPSGAAITDDGNFTWTPTESQDGDHTITVQVTDGSLTDSETLTVTVNEVNVAPVLNAIGDKGTSELVELTFTATASDTDVVDNVVNTLTFSFDGTFPSGAAITDDGNFTWTPTESQDGDHTITVQVTDGSLTDSETLTVTVRDVNVAPVLNTIDDQTVNEFVELTFTATASDDDSLTFSFDGTFPSGAAITDDGNFTWTPTESQDGDHTITVQVTDGSLTDSETLTVTVNEVNVAPVLNAIGDKGTSELVELTFTATASDTDVVDNVVNTLTFSFDGTFPSGAAITDDGNFTWTPTESQDGDHTITVQVTDGSLTDSETLTVTVNEVNVAPVLNTIDDQTVNEFVELTFTATASDDDSLTFSFDGTFPSGAAITDDGNFTWTPTESQDGDHTITVQVTDGSLTDSETLTVTVNEVNVAPVLNAIGDKGTSELVELTFTATASDTDVVDNVVNTLTFSFDGTFPSGAAITDDGNFTWTPTELQDGDHTITVQVTDGSLTDSETLTVTVRDVNVAPVLNTIDDQTVNEFVELTFTATASDDDSLTFSFDGTFPSGAAITDDGNFTWTPTELQDGDHTITVQVTDGSLTDSETLTVTVNEVNVAPVLNAIGDKGTSELVELTFTATASDTDVVDNVVNTLTFSFDGTFPLGAAITDDGNFTWTPTELQDGDHTITVQVTDGSLTDSETLTVTVKDTTAPVTTLPADAFITTWRTDSANQTITIPVGGSTARYSIDWGDNSPAETDITGDSTHTYREADSYTVSISGGLERIYLDGQQPNAGRLASIEQWGDTRWTTMDAAFYGARNMVYNAADSPDLSTVTDMSGMFGDAIAFNGDLSSWDVSKVTDMSDMFIFAYDFNGNLSSWDVSSVTNMNEMFAVATSFNGDLSSWDVSKVTDMSDMFIFATSFNGNLSSWDVSAVTDMSSMFDGTTAFNGDLSSWDVSSVTDMNNMFYYATSFNQPLNDWDVSSVTEMDGMFFYTPSFTQNLGNWYVTLDPDTIADTGIPGVVGTISAQNQPLKNHSPTYVIVDGLDKNHFEIVTGNQLNMISGVSEKAEYSVNVTASGSNVFESGNNWRVLVVKVSGDINAPPVLNTIDDQTVNEFVELTFTATASDDDSLIFSFDGTFPSGAAITDDGNFTWTPTESQDGDHTITVQVTDGSLTDSETLTVTVNEVNVAPVLNTIGDKGTSELVELTFTATASDTDVVDNVVNTLTFSFDGTFPSGAAITDDGNFTWTPTESQVGSHDITVQVTDGSLTDSETLTVTVRDVNAPPVLNTIDDQTVNEFVELTFTATASDDDSLTFSFDGTFPSGAAITDDGNFTWTPTESQDGDHTITVQVTDGSLTDSETLTVTVNEVNVAPVLSAIGDKGTSELVELTFTATASDTDVVDNVVNTLTFSFDGTSFPLGAAITDDGNFTWTPTESQDGDHTITVQVTDGSLTDSETLTVTVNEVNVAPVLNTIGDKGTSELVELTFTATASDTDVVDNVVNTLTFSFDGTFPSGAAITDDGNFTWTPTESQDGDHTITVQVTDGSLTDSETLTVTVKDTTAPDTDVPNVGVGATKYVKSGEKVDLRGFVDDPDNTELSYQWSHESGPNVFIYDDRTLTPYFIAPNVSGTQTIVIKLVVMDNEGGTNSDTININVRENQSPVIVLEKHLFVAAGDRVVLDASGSYDPDNDELSYEWIYEIGPEVLILGSGERVSFIAPVVGDNRFENTVYMILEVTDGALTDVVVFQIDITNNNKPVVNVDQSSISVASNSTFTLSGTLNDSDEDTNAWWSQTDGISTTSIDSFNDGDTFTRTDRAPIVESGTTVLTFRFAASDDDWLVEKIVTVTVYAP